ncbi:MAG TPA: hypothetical protein VL137_03590 [Polyangiaceae bacterium]|nr:hypothetical protein [Polyangiaceae bacterium]
MRRSLFRAVAASFCALTLSGCRSARETAPAPAVVATASKVAAIATASALAVVPPLPSAMPSAITSAAPAITQPLQIPEHNRADLKEIPERPPVGNAADKARVLLEAIKQDQPALAAEFFFPRDAFLLVKAIKNPGHYWDQLKQRYEDDIHTLHRTTADLGKAEFVGLEIVKRGGWVHKHKEGNALPYWASRHSILHYRVGSDERKLEVRVLISWDDQWWITHLSEFH